jgi:hypothetical protein
MLEGKRNRRLDHLIYILVHKCIPYFMARHRRQQFGFEGPDLELKRREEIGAFAKSITIDEIEEVVEGEIYLVQSRSDQTRKYMVNVDAYTCECAHFPFIAFCHHISAVQTHFTENFNIRPFSSAFPLPTEIANDTPESDEDLPADSTEVDSPDATVLANITDKLQRLAIRIRTRLAPPRYLTDALRELDGLLDHILGDSAQPQVLPKQVKVAPNQNSRTETAGVMVAKVKSKRKRQHTDAYSGGERSGKKAREDARVPLATQTNNRCAHSLRRFRFFSLTWTTLFLASHP